ncbi:hypothetical protein [Microbacterium sp. 77mftsu3.1]|uniref:hypothetical protein n=1 Tax=Microbacterium sp. 77mftsu3.1 TaxID=1761802 RepID=UPI000375F9E1|nr:hypothetical protein [Microbacterium sp. 77mftsu3.1]SDH35442.1 hypothetical protein SAMN04488590_3112 [Microbacterium sp. 77mftsu3.1]
MVIITNDVEASRENAREKATGRFGAQGHSAPEITLGASIDLSSWAPLAVDTKLADIYNQRATAAQPLKYAEYDLERKQGDLERAQADAEKNGGEHWEGQLDYYDGLVADAEEKVGKIWEQVDALTLEARPYEAEFRRRPWTRAYLVDNTNGHVHSSMHCSTCNRDGSRTSFAWMVDYSGMDEDQIVRDAGERACTTCYPSAPVSILNQPTKMFTPDEKRKQEERAEREKAKAEREAKKIANALTPDGSELVVYPEPPESGRRQWGESFKTERAAVIWATDQLMYAKWYGDREQDPARTKAKQDAIRVVAEAIATKHSRPVEFVLEELEIKAQVKNKDLTKKAADQALAAAAAKHGVAR